MHAHEVHAHEVHTYEMHESKDAGKFLICPKVLADAKCLSNVLAPSHPTPRKRFTTNPFHSVRPRQQSLASQFCLVLVKMNAIGVLNYRQRSLVL